MVLPSKAKLSVKPQGSHRTDVISHAINKPFAATGQTQTQKVGTATLSSTLMVDNAHTILAICLVVQSGSFILMGACANCIKSMLGSLAGKTFQTKLEPA
eukprot:gnl/MRDRNA2_/MRDRNA2_81364_c0_seq1.p1 gnl/MRDRNA2_/MRDRNA2_81364_c0~~gnl/MRDRNA2_/MRDRNA2_81364_c0_seq1.p1  ORF type:complete len:100 (-),score=13.47 gnl/MRDRNA2_/MRDRNA2_81364_c0_seq1:103-402(-)